MKPFVFLVALLLCAAIVLYALRYKGDVKAAFKIPFVEFSLETTDKNSPSKPDDAPPSKPEPAPESRVGARSSEAVVRGAK